MSESSSLKIQKLSREGDYRSWSQVMRAYLVTQDRADKYLDATPATNDADGQEKDLICKSKLMLHVTGPLISIVARAKSAKEAWNALKNDYKGSLKTRQPQLTEQLTKLSQGNDSISAYVDRLLALRDEFEALSMDASLPLLASQFIRGLRDDLRCALAPILHKIGSQEDATIDDIAREVKTLSLLLPDSASKARVNTADAGRRRPRSGNIACWNCGGKGHSAHDCPRPRDEDRVSRNQKKFQDARRKKPSDRKVKFNDQPATVMTVSSSTIASLRGRSNMLWLDSGATHHVVNDAGILRDTRTPTVSSVILGGGEEHPVLCEGDLFLTGGPRGSVLLTGVLHVPSMGINLVSTPQLTSKNGSCWEGPHFAHVYDPHGRTILKGHKIDGMYRLDCTLPKSSTAHVHIAASATLWHRRFGHTGHSCLKKMLRADAVKGIADVHFDQGSDPCAICDQAKLTRAHFARSSTRASHPVELVHSDTMGPMPVRGLEDELYVVTALDDFSGYAETILTRTKAEAASALVNLLVRWQRTTGRKLKTLRTDQGTEFLGVLSDYCTRKGISRQTSTVYTPEQNGRAERLNRTLIERSRALLLEHNLPKLVWSEAMVTASYLRNRVTSGDLKVTPYELFYGEKPDVSHLRVYGCKAFAYIEKNQRDKLDAVSDEYALVGYSTTSKAYRLLHPGVNGEPTIVEAISVRFHEDSAPSFLKRLSQENAAPALPGGGFVLPAQPLDPEYHPGDSNATASHTSAADDSEDADEDDGAEGEAPGTGGAATGVGDVEHGEEASVAGSNATGNAGTPAAPEVPEPDVPVVPDLSQLHLGDNAEPMDAEEAQPRRYPKRERNPPTSWYRNAAARLHTLDGLTDNPTSYEEVKQRPDRHLFDKAIADEMSQIYGLGVGVETELPVGVKPLPSRLVFNVKRDGQGQLDKYKARLVAKGFKQVPGRDYDEVFAPTAQHVTLRLLLAYASAHDLEVDQLDVKTAFLNGDLNEEVYIKLPPELGGKILRLHKALYGLKQAARAWFAKLRDSMIEHGFTPSKHEPCLFSRGQGADRVDVVVHVDDALLAGKRTAVNAAKADIGKMFEVKDLGPASHFLGMSIARQADSGYSLTQPKYVDDMLERFGMSNCKPAVTPMLVGQKLSKDTGTALGADNHYQALVGSLLYLSVNTRPDISHAVGILSRFMACPTDQHWEAAKHILRYLKGTATLGLRFAGSATSNQGVYTSEMYTDSDFAADLDKRRSITGAVMLMQGAAVLWISKLQSLVATSTTEAEFIAAAMGTKEGLWVRKLLGELYGHVQPLHLCVDNQAAIVLISEHTAGQSGRTKHIDVQFQFVRDRYQRGDVSVQYVPTADQCADMFTKQLGGPEFRRHRGIVLGM